MRNPFRRRRIETPPEVAAALASAGQYVAGGMSHFGALALAATDRGDVHYGTDDGAGSTHRGSRADCAHPDCAAPAPKRGPAMHFRPADWTMNAATGPTTACGKYVAVAWVTSVPGDVGCLGCQRTVIYRTRTSPAVIPAAGTTRKQES